MNRRGFFGGLGLLAAFGMTQKAGALVSKDARLTALQAGRRKVLTRATTGVGELVRHNPTVWNLPADAVLVEERNDFGSDRIYLKWAHELFIEVPEGGAYMMVDERTPLYFYRTDAEWPAGPRGPFGPVGQSGCPAGAFGSMGGL